MQLSAAMFSLPHPDGWLDVVANQPEGFLVEGWAFVRSESGASFPKVIITSDWKEVARIDSGNKQRPDVLDAFRDIRFDGNIGFAVLVPHELVGSRGAASLQVMVLNSDNTVSILKKGFKRVLQMELTGRCNLRCPMCPSVIYSDFHKKELADSEISDVLGFLQDRDYVCLDGFGESLLAPGFDAILNSVPRATEVVFHTNGLLLDKKTDVILMNSPPVHWIAVSLDSLDSEKYARLRAGSSLEKVLANIRSFKARRDELGLAFPIIRLNLTLMKENYLELAAFIRTAKEFDGVVECNWLYDVEHLADGVSIEVGGHIFDYESNKLKHIAKDANEHIASAKALAKEMGVEMVFNSYFNESLSATPDNSGFSGAVSRSVSECPHLQGGDFMLQADGKVQNCVWQTSPLMDWRETGLENVKGHPRVKTVREMAANNVIPNECSGAGCSYVRLRHSEENVQRDIRLGGYSGDRVSAKRALKIKKV